MFRGDWTSYVLCALASAALGACGGGGGSSATTAPLTKTTVGTPTPSSGPAGGSTAANGTGTISSYPPFGVTTDTAMGYLGYARVGGATRWLDPSELGLGWVAATRTFRLNALDYGPVSLADDPDNLARAAVLLVDGTGTKVANGNFLIPAFGLTLLGSFGPIDPRATGTAASFLYFDRSSAGAVQSGMADFVPQDVASKMKISVNFADGTAIGTIAQTWTDAFGPYPEKLYTLENGRYDRDTGTITASYTIPESGLTGELRGQVLGNGTGIAVAARGAVFNPYDEKWVEDWVLIELAKVQ